jgi:hypothetical protein
MPLRPTGSNRSNSLGIVAFTHQLTERVRLSRGVNNLQFARRVRVRVRVRALAGISQCPVLTSSLCHPSLPPFRCTTMGYATSSCAAGSRIYSPRRRTLPIVIRLGTDIHSATPHACSANNKSHRDHVVCVKAACHFTRTVG